MNKKVLITAGPTYEAIDPVRFIGNHSTGKMGFAIAEAFAEQGADVTIIAGPVSLKPHHRKINVIPVVSASEMLKACQKLIGEADIAVFAAAVADFTPEESFDKKVKRGSEDITLRLKPTADIAAELGKTKRDDQLFVGFALETHDGIVHATDKLKRKNLDMIVLNSLEDQGAGFGADTNKVTILDKSGNIDNFELKLKSAVAIDVVEKTLKLLNDA